MDRAAGIEYWLAQGWDVHVVSKIYTEDYRRDAEAVAERLGFKLTLLPYEFLKSHTSWSKIKTILYRLTHPWYLDGAAYEYSQKETVAVVNNIVDNFKPQLVWFDYTYLWPLYGIFKRRGIPIITRSINFEATHAVEESGGTIASYLVYPFKWFSEYLTARKSNYLFAITPHEAKRYKAITKTAVVTLPLRCLAAILKQLVTVRDRKPLEVGFAGSTYNVAHNKAALQFLLRDIAPLAERLFSGEFRFHIFGSKIPAEFNPYFNMHVIKHGYLEDSAFNEWQNNLDIVVAPSLAGAGMQQKIFEPLTRGIPTITSPRGLAGYPFVNNQTVLTATTATEFVSCLGKLQAKSMRERLSHAARQQAEKLFSAQALNTAITHCLEKLI